MQTDAPILQPVSSRQNQPTAQTGEEWDTDEFWRLVDEILEFEDVPESYAYSLACLRMQQREVQHG